MKQFSIVVFGGLAVVLVGISLAWVVRSAQPAAPVQEDNGTTRIGMTRTISYTADEEEDLVNEAVQGLHDPSGKITALSYIVKDLTTGEVYTELDSTRSLPIASLTKLVTAIVARKSIQKNSPLLYPLLMISSNEAAETIAQNYGRKTFLANMNSFVRSIDAYRTYFADPSGLSPLNVSSAGDLALIMDWIRQNDPGILDITLLKSKTVGLTTWDNPTHFLSWSYYLGGKNGFTDEANRTGVSLFKLGYKKDTYVIVVLGSDNRDADVIRLINKVK